MDEDRLCSVCDLPVAGPRHFGTHQTARDCVNAVREADRAWLALREWLHGTHAEWLSLLRGSIQQLERARVDLGDRARTLRSFAWGIKETRDER